MCEHGINVDQLKVAVAQSDDALAMVQQWIEQLHHLTDHSERSEACRALTLAGTLLVRARSELEAALSDLDGHHHDRTSIDLI